MLVSIVVPSYNKQAFVSATIESVIAQTHQNWELILVDDNSTDGTQVVLKQFASHDERIKVYINNKNMGGNFCRNYGIQLSKGEFIIFLDADDLLSSFCLEQRTRFAESDTNNDLWIFPMGVFKKSIGDLPASMAWIPKSDTPEGYLNNFLKHRLPWHTMQPLWRKSKLIELNGFDESFIRLQDVELHTRALLIGSKVSTDGDGQIDSYFRVDDNRKIDSEAVFLEKFVRGAIRYYEKFYSSVKLRNQRKMLSCVLLETTSNVLFSKRIKRISGLQLSNLNEELVKCCKIKHHRFFLRCYSKLDQLSPVHPKGLKAIIALLLKL